MQYKNRGKMMNKLEITKKQKSFADEYLKDYNGKQAAIRAGYSEKSAENQASRMLSYAKVAEYLGKRQIEKEKKIGITIEAIIDELQEVGFGIVDGDKLKMNDKIKALELLGKHLGMFSESKDKETEVNIQVQVLTINGSNK